MTEEELHVRIIAEVERHDPGLDVHHTGRLFHIIHSYVSECVARARVEEASCWHQFGEGHDVDGWCCAREKELGCQLMALEANE